MKVLILVAFLIGAVAAEECGENQRYTRCGTTCPLTCDNYDDPPMVCNFMCHVGCECLDGFVETEDGQCVRPENCPSRNDNIVFPDDDDEHTCDEEPEEGMCRGYFPMWYFDKSSGSCKEFVYGGCLGNGNRYDSEEECNQHCAAKAVKTRSDEPNCSDEPETGMCEALFRMWYFDPETETCKQFIYGGCGGNGNRFASKEKCSQFCGAKNVMQRTEEPNCSDEPESGMCDAYFPMWYFDTASETCKEFVYGGCGGNGNRYQTKQQCTEMCEDSIKKPACEQEKMVGPCNAAFRRFFFNKETGECESFIYGGCRGNDNNFQTKEDCEDVCIRVSIES